MREGGKEGRLGGGREKRRRVGREERRVGKKGGKEGGGEEKRKRMEGCEDTTGEGRRDEEIRKGNERCEKKRKKGP